MVFLEMMYCKKCFCHLPSRKLKGDADDWTVMKGGWQPSGFSSSGRIKDAFLLLDSLSFWETVGGKPTR